MLADINDSSFTFLMIPDFRLLNVICRLLLSEMYSMLIFLLPVVCRLDRLGS